MKNADRELVDTQTLLIMAAFRKIADFLDSKQIDADWSAELTTANISFIGKNGNRCEFRTKLEFVMPGREVFVFFNYDRGKVCETDFTGAPAADFTPEKLVEHFKGIFEQELGG